MRDEQIREIIRRIIYLPIFLFVISFVIFTFARVVPGDPAYLIAGPKASKEAIESIRQEYGFNKPIPVQYKNYMTGMLQGNLGKSIIYPDEDIKSLILPRAKVSAILGIISLLIILGAGIVSGLLAAIKKGWTDSGLIGFFLIFSSIPVLITVLFLIYLFVIQLGWFNFPWQGDWKTAFSLRGVIPIIALCFPSIGGFARYVRTLTMNVLTQDYVLVAEASGFSFWHVAFRYILRNSLLPIITVVIPSLFFVFMGAFFVEKIYGIQGMAVFMLDVAFQRDYDVLVGMTILLAFLFVIANLVADILYTIIDPRISLSKKT